jgi:hypothetical protein
MSGIAGNDPSLQLHQSIVHGDFYIWSSGPKLTAEYIAGAYVGLNRTAVTHNNDNGVLVPAQVATASNIRGTNIPSGMYGSQAGGAGSSGAVASAPPDSPTTASMAALAAHSAVGTGGKQTGAPRSPSSAAGTAATHGYYVVHLFECVVRPDVELRHLLASVLKVARTRDCKCYFPHNNHIVLKAQQPAAPQSRSASAGAIAAAGQAASEAREWDQIDVQVVLSQEVRQRMLVCQFLRRVPSLTSSGFGNLNLIIYQIGGGAAPLPLGASPKTKSFVSKLKVAYVTRTYSGDVSLVGCGADQCVHHWRGLIVGCDCADGLLCAAACSAEGADRAQPVPELALQRRARDRVRPAAAARRPRRTLPRTAAAAGTCGKRLMQVSRTWTLFMSFSWSPAPGLY